jgi:hypothetical protein
LFNRHNLYARELAEGGFKESRAGSFLDHRDGWISSNASDVVRVKPAGDVFTAVG